MDLRQLSTVWLVRLYNRVGARMLAGYGYQPYGFDTRTLRINHPGLWVILDAIAAEYKRRLHS